MGPLAPLLLLLALAAALCRAQAPAPYYAVGFSSDPTWNSSTSRYLFVGSKANFGDSPPTWLNHEAGGLLGYFDSNSLVESVPATNSTSGIIAVSAAVRASQETGPLYRSTIAFGSYASNDDVNATGVWNYYGSGYYAPNATGTLLGYEQDICNQAAYVAQDAYLIGQPGTTANLWMASGGEWAQAFPGTCNPTSAAIALVNNGARHGKGMVVACGAIQGTYCNGTGTSTAFQMAKGHEIEWEYASNVPAARLGSSNNAAAAASQMYFRNAGVEFEDITTGSTLFEVQNPTGSVANHVSVAPGTAGNGATIYVTGSDASPDLYLRPKNQGNVYVTPGGFKSLRVTGVNNSVNFLTIGPAVTGGAVNVIASGGDSSVSLALRSTNNGDVELNPNGLAGLFVKGGVASPVNHMEVTNSATGNPVLLATVGSDAAIDMKIQLAGAGRVWLPSTLTSCSTCAFVPAGSLAVKDSSGTVRWIPVANSAVASPGPDDDPADFALVTRKELKELERGLARLEKFYEASTAPY